MSRSAVPRRSSLALALACLIAALGALAPTASAASTRRITDELVVRFAPGTPAAARARVARAAGAADIRHLVGTAWLLRARRGDELRRTARALERRAAVVSATPNYRARVAAFAPNDTGVAAAAGAPGAWSQQQWDLVGPFGVNVGGAWDIAQQSGAPGGRRVRVAVVDTGVAYADRGRLRRSPDIAPARVLRGHDFVSNDDFPNDVNGHGTFVASTIAASANNGYGMVGIAYAADILPVRVLNSQGGGGSARIAEGIRYAVNRGAQVINASIELFDPLAFPPRGLSITTAPEIREAIRYAADRDVVIVAAAGNLGQNDVPSNRLGQQVIYVGGTTEHGCVGDYSNYGRGLDLVAPGGGADAPIAGDPSCRADLPPGRNISQVTFRRSRPARFLVPTDYRGTSMAAPHVTGVVALMLGARTLGRDPSPNAVEQRLEATARDLGAPGRDRRYGAGLVDATAALAAPR
ncbi:MAG TPA: S8 family serine peptidase [Solirubrobacteraceae bacterium]|nr:S8 family serine peptidase [Solirubrobacteraceae bacterium]